MQILRCIIMNENYLSLASTGIRILNKQRKLWLGKDYKTVTNKAGDNIFMSKAGQRKMRFDTKNPFGDAPHIHLEIQK